MQQFVCGSIILKIIDKRLNKNGGISLSNLINIYCMCVRNLASHEISRLIHGHRMSAGERQKIKQNRPSKKLNHDIVILAHMYIHTYIMILKLNKRKITSKSLERYCRLI